MSNDNYMTEIRRLRFGEGLSVREVAKELGISKQNTLKRLRRMPDYFAPPIYPTKRDWIKHSRKPRAQALEEASPWLPEDGIIDPVVAIRVEKNDGCPVRATENEAREVIRQLYPKGLTDTQIAQRLGASHGRIKDLRESMGIEKVDRSADSWQRVYETLKVTKKRKPAPARWAGTVKGKKVA